MSGVIAMNNIRQELRLEERYEKPKYKRQRLASARHRRRFAREVGLKVAAIMKAKRQGM
jgi:small subunit ribosomal protein MRP21